MFDEQPGPPLEWEDGLDSDDDNPAAEEDHEPWVPKED